MLPTHARYPYSAITERESFDWPGGRRVAVYICIAAEHFAFNAGIGEDLAVPGARQDDRNYAWKDYGRRVGLWRLLDLMSELGLPAAIAANGWVFDHEPGIARRIATAGHEIIAYGRTSSETTSTMWDIDEAAAIAETTSLIRSATGTAPRGWASPGVVESSATPDLLAGQGYRYVLDWPNDDRPVWLQTTSRPILSVPFSLETSDIAAVLHCHHGAREYGDMLINQFDELLRRSASGPVVMPIFLHPYVSGHPFRIRNIRRALRHILDGADRETAWFTTPGEIAAHCEALPPNMVP